MAQLRNEVIPRGTYIVPKKMSRDSRHLIGSGRHSYGPVRDLLNGDEALSRGAALDGWFCR